MLVSLELDVVIVTENFDKNKHLTLHLQDDKFSQYPEEIQCWPTRSI